ncbi:MAG: T9SS type A sorting domain-containing protein, partial [Bacteroidales bacterium]
ALVSNEQASTGNKSLKVLAGNDNVLLLTDTNTGIHTIEWDIFVPAGKKAYHSVMQEFIDGDHVTRGVEIYFSEGTVGHIKTAGNIQVEFNYTPNTWVHNAKIIDLDQDVAVFTTGGHVVHTWQWSNTGIKRLRGMNIFGENQASTLYYIDNIDYVSSLDSTRILLASADANGSISPVGAQIVPVGSTQSFTMTPNANCVINDVLVDGSSVLNQLVGNVYSFTNVMANHSIHATFRDTSTVIVEYTITASAGMGGTITPSGDVVVTAGTSKTFTMTAQPGYEIQQVLVDGNNEGLLNSYTFNNILANHLIHVDFNNVGIEDVSIANQVQLSPNPADNFIYIGVSDQLTVKEAGIYDVYGKLVKDLSIKDKNTEINVSALSSGIYFVRLSCDEGFIAKKFVKK